MDVVDCGTGDLLVIESGDRLRGEVLERLGSEVAAAVQASRQSVLCFDAGLKVTLLRNARAALTPPCADDPRAADRQRTLRLMDDIVRVCEMGVAVRTVVDAARDAISSDPPRQLVLDRNLGGEAKG